MCKRTCFLKSILDIGGVVQINGCLYHEVCVKCQSILKKQVTTLQSYCKLPFPARPVTLQLRDINILPSKIRKLFLLLLNDFLEFEIVWSDFSDNDIVEREGREMGEEELTLWGCLDQ